MFSYVLIEVLLTMRPVVSLCVDSDDFDGVWLVDGVDSGGVGGF